MILHGKCPTDLVWQTCKLVTKVDFPTSRGPWHILPPPSLSSSGGRGPAMFSVTWSPIWTIMIAIGSYGMHMCTNWQAPSDFSSHNSFWVTIVTVLIKTHDHKSPANIPPSQNLRSEIGYTLPQRKKVVRVRGKIAHLVSLSISISFGDVGVHLDSQVAHRSMFLGRWWQCTIS